MHRTVNNYTKSGRSNLSSNTLSILSSLVIGDPHVATAGCDIVTADLRAEESSPWHKTYTLAPGGHFELHNVNGKIDVEPSTGNTVDVTAVKKARGA